MLKHNMGMMHGLNDLYDSIASLPSTFWKDKGSRKHVTRLAKEAMLVSNMMNIKPVTQNGDKHLNNSIPALGKAIMQQAK